MSDINNYICTGRLTRDPEMRFTTSGTGICNMSIAVNDYQKNKDEEYVNYIDIVCFGKTAENCNEYLSKGSAVTIQGVLKQQRWEKDGNKRNKIVVNAFTVKFMRGGEAKKKKQGGSDSYDPPIGEDDIPF